MKHQKIASVLLSVSMCMSLIVTPVSVLADETPSETETIETTKETEPKETEKKKPAETKVSKETEKPAEETEATEATQKPAETTKEEKEPESSKESENETESSESETKPSESVPSETKEQVPEETVPEETETTEPSVSESVPESEDKKPARNEMTGKCGNNLTWTISDEGEYGLYLDIKGSGDMYNWTSLEQTPWHQYAAKIWGINLPDDITSIGDYAFAGCGISSFYGPSTKLKKIGNYAFSNCSGLSWLEFPKTLTSIGTGAFYNSTQIQHLVFPNSVTSIGTDAFYGCYLIREVTIPGSLKTLAGSVFNSCTQMEKVTFLNGVSTIDAAFPGCTEIKTVVIPKSVTSIKASAFADCSALTDVYYSGSESDWNNISIGSSNGYLTNAAKHFSSFAASGKHGNNLTWVLDDKGVLTITGSGEMSDNISVPGWSSVKEYIKSIRFDGNITTISYSAFEECTSLTQVAIPVGVKEIHAGAFLGCTNLKNAYLPSTVTDIGGSAFSGCSALESITIPASVETIESQAFYNCKNLKNVVVPDSVTALGSGAFSNCSGLTSVTISKNIKSIEYATFAGCSNLTEIVIPDGVTKIGNFAFEKSPNLKTITIPKSVDTIGSFVFNNSDNLTVVNYGGTKEDWEKINTDDYNDELEYVTVKLIDGTTIPGLKRDNTLKVSGGKTYKLKYKKLRRKKQTVSRAKLMAVSGAQGRVTYKITSVSKKKYKKYFKINASTGTVTVKKKLKKGKYTIKVTVTAAGNEHYKSITRTSWFKIKVK